MVRRLLNLSKNHSFFLFGPRGSGKSTLLHHHFKGQNVLNIDLLTDAAEARYARDPDRLLGDIRAGRFKWVIVDEVQKVPKILDIVHKAIEVFRIRKQTIKHCDGVSFVW